MILTNRAFLTHLKLLHTIPIAWSINPTNITDPKNFVPAFLTRISKSVWELTNENNLEMEQIEWDNANGIKYGQHDRFVHSASHGEIC